MTCLLSTGLDQRSYSYIKPRVVSIKSYVAIVQGSLSSRTQLHIITFGRRDDIWKYIVNRSIMKHYKKQWSTILQNQAISCVLDLSLFTAPPPVDQTN